MCSKTTKFLFCNVYRRGDCEDVESNEILHRINELSTEYEHVVVCGDFNANRFDANRYSKLSRISNCMNLINDQCPTYIVGNFNPSQIDLMYTKNRGDVRCFCHFPAVGVSHHDAICGIFNFYTTRKVLKTYEIRNLNNITDGDVDNFVRTVDWSIFQPGADVDIMVNDLYGILNRFLNEVCPSKTITSRHCPVPWMTKEIRDLMASRKIYYDWWRINRKHQAADIIYASYAKLNNQIKYSIRKSGQNTFIDEYDECETSREKWNLIHKFGVTRKAKKSDTRNINFNDDISINTLNAHFTKLKLCFTGGYYTYYKNENI